MNEPLISVIIPAYNARSFIIEALDSVYSMTFRDFEVIVVDDGSTDGTSETVIRYQSQLDLEDPKLTFIAQPNGGPSRARNMGVKQAQGELIAFLDADDLWFPETLASMVAAIEKHPQCGLVFGDASSFDKTGTLVTSVFDKFGRPLLSADGCVERPFNALLENNFILTGTVLIRKQCLLETGCFDQSIRYGEDADVWLRAALLSPMALIPEVLLHRRIHEGNASNVSINRKNKCDYLTIKIYSLRKLLSENDTKLEWVSNAIKMAILKTKKRRAYWFYLEKKYIKSLVLYFYYFYSKIKMALLDHD